jgi:hypothetical protein
VTEKIIRVPDAQPRKEQQHRAQLKQDEHPEDGKDPIGQRWLA